MTAWSDLARLGHHVVSGRVTLGYRNRTELANSLPFTVRTLADIEQRLAHGQPRHPHAMRENKLTWAQFRPASTHALKR